jgi:hypothetical protein
LVISSIDIFNILFLNEFWEFIFTHFLDFLHYSLNVSSVIKALCIYIMYILVALNSHYVHKKY